LNENFPQTAETSANLGIAFGLKLVHNRYKGKDNLFGEKVNAFSFTPRVFYGPGVVSLESANTNGMLSTKRGLLTNTFGGFAMFGLNRLNFGLGVGWSYASGNANSSWVYQGKRWWGIALSLDFIK
jgi:hypothetical protein